MSESKSASVVFTNGSLLAKNAQNTADSAKTAAETAQDLASGAQKTADGKNSVYRGSDPSTVPTAGLKEGDIYFTANALYTWNGTAWEETVSDTTGEEIHKKVEDAMQESQKAAADLESRIEDKVKKLDKEIEDNKIQTGNALNFYKEQYYLSTSYTELAGGSWSDEVPVKTAGKYVWSRYVTANIGDPTNHQYSDPVCISGLDGAEGPQGPTGVPGPQGPQGVPGPKGADGRTTYVHVAYANSADGKSGFSVDYFIDALYIGILTDYTQDDSPDHTRYTWSRLKGDAGDQGSPGPKGDNGQTTYVHFAYANSSDGTDNFNVNYFDGALYIGTYTNYTQADSTDYTKYTWSRLKGETGPTGATGPKGDTGAQGIPGPKGDNGQTTYVHFAYANSADGKTNFNVSYFDNALYVGTYTDYTQTDSSDYTKYIWSRLKGETGQTGATGAIGPQGSDGTDAPTITVKSYTYSAVNGARADIELTGPNAFKQTVSSRGHNIWVLDAVTHKLKEFVNCDTYTAMSFSHNGTSTTLADYLASLTDSIVVIATADADTIDQDTRNVLNNMGGSPELGTWGAGRVGHVFIGMSKRSDGTWPLQPRQGYEEVIEKDGSAPEIGCTLSNGGIVANGATGPTGPTGATGPQGPQGVKGDTGSTGFFIGTTPPPNPVVGTVWATNDSSGNMTSARKWNGSNWVSTAFTQDLVAGNISATKIVGGELDVNKITIKNAQNIPITSTVSLGDKLSNIEQDANGLTSTVIGGGNLLNNTSDTLQSVTVDHWSRYTTSDDEPIAKHLLDGQTVTLSAWIENPSKDAWVQMWTDNGRFTGNIIPAGGKGWSQVTYTMPSGFTYWNIVVGCGDNSGTVTLSYSSLQLELGPNRTAWSQSTADISLLKITADSINAYVNKSSGSKYLKALLNLDPDNTSISQLVNGQVVSAINLSKEGKVQIDGSRISLNAATTIADATIKSAMIESIDATKILTGELDAGKVTITHLTADKIAAGTLNGMTITGSTFMAVTPNTTINGRKYPFHEVNVYGNGITMDTDTLSTSFSAGTLKLHCEKDPLLSTRDIVVSLYSDKPFILLSDDKNGNGTMLDSTSVTSQEGTFGNLKTVGNKMFVLSGNTFQITNSVGQNNNSGGTVGLSIWGGLGFGKQTIYTQTDDIYCQKGDPNNGALSESYSSATPATVHAQKLISQVANTVASRLSIKTDITPVSYDRALAAVEGTDMYDYRYVADDSGQHYVSGIIDDVNSDPQYHMDGMLINQERTARIDANIIGYHHVVIQKLLERVAALEEKEK